MAVKLSHMLFGAFVLLFVLQPCVIKSLKLDSLQNLEQVQKGGGASGINQVKQYLKRYGYYPHGVKLTLDDRFDDFLESALKAYQQFLYLDVTGKIDSATIKTMMTPRCGMPDNQGESHLISNYNTTNSKWRKYNLSYSISNAPSGFKVNGVETVFARAMKSWADVSPFKFTKNSNSDIKVAFYSNNHGDYPFYDPVTGNEAYAHAFYPQDGRVHFNTLYTWSTSPTSRQADMESIAVHELGHTLGLNHSGLLSAIMYPYIDLGTIKRTLTQDDKDGLKAMYKY
ncbi:hypothetical protein like AT4G16640 [Hibiscus trionum]|uniref:Peptidase metallopeptidase domain-containing protein n=1 Tax=Hibiscus trionum TaxID=183268 RepID=A0A9W7I5C2_HIBTR|nr:hypothetical protein like AT4G16640 [Hibiscus trionum]